MHPEEPVTQPAYTDADVEAVERVLRDSTRCLHRDKWTGEARAVLAALAAAGRLMPLATATEWGVHFLDSKTRQRHSKVYEAVTERQARAFAVSHCHVGEVGEVVTRKVTPWIATEEPA